MLRLPLNLPKTCVRESRYLCHPQSLPFLPQTRYLSIPPLWGCCRGDFSDDTLFPAKECEVVKKQDI